MSVRFHILRLLESFWWLIQYRSTIMDEEPLEYDEFIGFRLAESREEYFQAREDAVNDVKFANGKMDNLINRLKTMNSVRH